MNSRYLRPLALLFATPLILTACVSGSRPAPPPRGGASVALPPLKPVRPAANPAPVLARPADPGAVRPPAGLEQAIDTIWRSVPGKTGIAVRRIDGDWSVARRGGDLFPQQSVSKLWVTLAALDQVDRGRLSLADTVRIGPDDLTLFHQPLAARVAANGSVTERIDSLIEQAMTKSDNSANDAILRRIGGPDAVRGFLRDARVAPVRFGPGERLMQSRIAGLDWNQSLSVGRAFYAARDRVPIDVRQRALAAYLADPVDGATPDAIADALTRLARGSMLSPASTRHVLDVMERTSSGPNRLKGGLSPGWRIAHKTGTGQILNGTATGFNNIGILTAPDGTRYAVVIMMADTTAGVPARLAAMQNVTRAVVRYHGM